MKSTKLLFVSALAIVLGACASTDEKKAMEQTVQNEAPATAQGELALRGANVFINSPNLTAEQKEKVMAVHTAAYEKASKIREELTQTKSALFKSLVSPNSTKKEISMLKSKIMSLDKERLDVMLKAFDDVQKIVGKDAITEDVIKHFEKSTI